MKRPFKKGLYANVTATMALIVALGGTSYAAIALPSNSVGTQQIKASAVTKGKLKNGAVTSGKVKDGSLLGKDFKSGQLPAGPAGPAGPTGAAGAIGPIGPIGPSTAFAADSANNVLNWTGAQQTVQTLDLPAGSYVLMGKLIANNNGAGSVDVNCKLNLDGVVDSGFDVVTNGIDGDDRNYMVVAGIKTIAAPSTVTITCTAGASGNYLNRVITAVKVGSLG